MNWVRRYWGWVLGIAIVIAIGMLISTFRENHFCKFIIDFFDDWSVALSAGAAVTLAVVAFRTIKISSKQTKFLSDQIRLLRQERLLKILEDVHAWANDMANLRLEIQREGRTPDQITTFFVGHWTAVLRANETNGRSLKRQIEKIWPFLGSSIGEVLNSISELYRYLLFEYKGMQQMQMALEKSGMINASAQNLLVTVDSVKSFVLSIEYP
jgi:hypothetical protein